MKGWSPWPGKVCHPTPELQKSKSKSTKTQFCVWFFGTNNYAWIEEHSIKDYDEFKDRLSKTCKTAAFKEAYAAAEDYITRKAAGIDVDAEIFADQDSESQTLSGEGMEEDSEDTALADTKSENDSESDAKKVSAYFYNRLRWNKFLRLIDIFPNYNMVKFILCILFDFLLFHRRHLLHQRNGRALTTLLLNHP